MNISQSGRPYLTPEEMQRREEWAAAATSEWDATQEVVNRAAELCAGLSDMDALRQSLTELLQARRRKTRAAGKHWKTWEQL